MAIHALKSTTDRKWWDVLACKHVELPISAGGHIKLHVINCCKRGLFLRYVVMPVRSQPEGTLIWTLFPFESLIKLNLTSAWLVYLVLQMSCKANQQFGTTLALWILIFLGQAGDYLRLFMMYDWPWGCLRRCLTHESSKSCCCGGRWQTDLWRT